MKIPLEARSFDQNVEKLYERFAIFSLLYPQIISAKPSSHTDWQVQIPLQEVQILYIAGIDANIYEQLQPWLKKSSSHQLIFLENDFARLHKALHTPTDLFTNDQVHIEWLADSDPKKMALELAERFSNAKCKLLSHPDFQMKGYKDFERDLLSHATLFEAVLCDTIFSEKLFANFYHNLQRVVRSFPATSLQGKFSNIPAIICGAGPSLEKSVPFLKELENRALLFAGGSAITCLSRLGVFFHIATACDPTPEEVQRIKRSSAFEVPFFYSTRVHHEVFSAINGPLNWVHTPSGGVFERWLAKACQLDQMQMQENLSKEALSVSTLNIALATFLGCNPIIFCGMDLSYTEGKSYAKEVVSEKKRFIKNPLRKTVKDIFSNPVETTHYWQMEAKAITQFISEHREIEFINATEAGLGFTGACNTPLSVVAKDLLQDSYDLIGQLHSACSEELHSLKKPIKKQMQCLQKDLQVCLEKVKILEKETSHMKSKKNPTVAYVCAKMELEEQEIYQTFFSLYPYHLAKFFRYHQREAKQQSALELEKEIWAFLALSLKHYLRLYS